MRLAGAAATARPCLVRVLHGGQAVRDDHDRAPLHQLLDRRLHQPLVLNIQRAGGLIQDEDGGVLQQASWVGGGGRGVGPQRQKQQTRTTHTCQGTRHKEQQQQ